MASLAFDFLSYGTAVLLGLGIAFGGKFQPQERTHGTCESCGLPAIVRHGKCLECRYAHLAR